MAWWWELWGIAGVVSAFFLWWITLQEGDSGAWMWGFSGLFFHFFSVSAFMFKKQRIMMGFLCLIAGLVLAAIVAWFAVVPMIHIHLPSEINILMSWPW